MGLKPELFEFALWANAGEPPALPAGLSENELASFCEAKKLFRQAFHYIDFISKFWLLSYNPRFLKKSAPRLRAT